MFERKNAFSTSWMRGTGGKGPDAICTFCKKYTPVWARCDQCSAVSCATCCASGPCKACKK